MPEQVGRNDDVLLSQLTESAADDLSEFLLEMEKIQQEHDRAIRDGRQAVIDRYGIAVCNGEPLRQPIPAVDSGNVIDTRLGVAVAFVAGVYYGSTVKTNYKRIIAAPEMVQGNLATLLRLWAELDLLSRAEETVIMDNSFWSVLQNANVVAYQHKNGAFDQDNIQDFLDLTISQKDSLFLHTIRNPSIIAMSKSAVADALSKTVGYEKLKDKILMTLVLNEDEFLEPLLLGKGELNARFGIHPDIGDAETRKEIDSIYAKDLLVTFYKPWRFKPAYRVEFHKSQWDGFPNVLRRIKWDTRHQTIIEPENQFLADRFAKSVGGLVEMYKSAAAHRYPDIYRSFRS